MAWNNDEEIFLSLKGRYRVKNRKSIGTLREKLRLNEDTCFATIENFVLFQVSSQLEQNCKKQIEELAECFEQHEDEKTNDAATLCVILNAITILMAKRFSSNVFLTWTVVHLVFQPGKPAHLKHFAWAGAVYSGPHTILTKLQTRFYLYKIHAKDLLNSENCTTKRNQLKKKQQIWIERRLFLEKKLIWNAFLLLWDVSSDSAFNAMFLHKSFC